MQQSSTSAHSGLSNVKHFNHSEWVLWMCSSAIRSRLPSLGKKLFPVLSTQPRHSTRVLDAQLCSSLASTLDRRQWRMASCDYLDLYYDSV
jgi:hypothetical protein